jgi:hypothetical protein
VPSERPALWLMGAEAGGKTRPERGPKKPCRVLWKAAQLTEKQTHPPPTQARASARVHGGPFTPRPALPQELGSRWHSASSTKGRLFPPDTTGNFPKPLLEKVLKRRQRARACPRACFGHSPQRRSPYRSAARRQPTEALSAPAETAKESPRSPSTGGACSAPGRRRRPASRPASRWTPHEWPWTRRARPDPATACGCRPPRLSPGGPVHAFTTAQRLLFK